MSMWVQKIDQTMYADRANGTTIPNKEFLKWMSATTTMRGTVTVQMTPEKKKYIRIDFEGITPNAQLKVIRVKFKQTDGSIVYITPNPSFSVTVNCIEVAYETEWEYFYINNAPAFEQGCRYGSREYNLQNQENTQAFKIISEATGAVKLEEFQDIYTVSAPGLYIDDHNMRGLAYAQVDGMPKWDLETEGGFSRNIQWLDGQSNNQRAYNFIPRPFKLTTPRVKKLSWEKQDSIFMVYGYNESNEVISHQTFTTNQDIFLIIPKKQKVEVNVIPKEKVLINTNDHRRRESSIGEMSFTLNFTAYDDPISNVYTFYRIDSSAVVEEPMTYEDLIEFGGLSPIDVSDLSNIFILPIDWWQKQSLSTLYHPVKTTISPQPSEYSFIYSYTMEPILSASFSSNESQCLEITGGNKITLPDGCRIRDVVYNNTLFLKNRVIQSTTDSHYITLYRGTYANIFTLYETSFNNDIGQFSMHWKGNEDYNLTIEESDLFAAEFWTFTTEYED